MKKYTGKEILKKCMALCLLCLCFAVLGITAAGCSRVEPERRAYPLAMGLDWAEGKHSVYYAMPDLSTFTGEGKSAGTEELLWVYAGEDYKEIEKQVRQTKGQEADLGHVQVILLGEGLLGNTQAYDTTMKYLLKQPVLGSGSYMFQCPELKKVMEENGNVTDSLGEYLSDLLKKEKAEPVVLQDLYNAWYNKESRPQLMTVRIVEGKIEVEGLA